jgi:hypothetical protein
MNNKKRKAIETVVILASVVFGGPLLSIWAVNPLFSTVTNWFAWLVLMVLWSFPFK